MGIKNYLIEGVSCTGKTSVARELQRRGFHAINCDNELAYQGDPITGEPLKTQDHFHHIWNIEKLNTLTRDHSRAATFFCGGSRNFGKFIHLMDKVFVLEIDLDTLNQRLAIRPKNEWGGQPAEQLLIRQLHASKQDIPKGGIIVDATAPIENVVDAILAECG